MKHIAKVLLVLMLALCMLTTLISCGEDDVTDDPTTEVGDTTPSGEDAPEEPKADPLVNKGGNTEEGWSDVK